MTLQLMIGIVIGSLVGFILSAIMFISDNEPSIPYTFVWDRIAEAKKSAQWNRAQNYEALLEDWNEWGKFQ